MRIVLSVVFLLLISGAFPAAASIRHLNPEPGSGCGDINPDEACYAYTMGADYSECKALGAYLQKCYECGEDSRDREICVAVRHTANCYCMQDQKDDLGKFVQCASRGKCTFSEF